MNKESANNAQEPFDKSDTNKAATGTLGATKSPKTANLVRRSRNDGKGGLVFDNNGYSQDPNSAGQSTQSIYKQEHVRRKIQDKMFGQGTQKDAQAPGATEERSKGKS